MQVIPVENMTTSLIPPITPWILPRLFPCLLAAGLCLMARPLPAEVKEGALQAFEQACRTSMNEPWRSVPWKVSLIEAQNLAARERKPIFIWAMDGHPLGCT